MRLAYFDCFSGISGDMALAALVDAGAELAAITAALGSFPLDDAELRAESVEFRGLSAIRLHVHTAARSVIRTYANIRELLEGSDLPPTVRRTALRMYQRLAQAASTVSGKDADFVTFHEFGDLDCLVEFVGVATALDLLGVERVFASAIPTGMGMVRTEHGIMPVPTPVVVELLHGVPTYSGGIPVELVTATGAAILAAISEGYGDMPLMRADHVGYGAGHPRLDAPNAVRVVIGEEQRAARTAVAGTSLLELAAREDVLVQGMLEAAEDDDLVELMEVLTAVGARDVWTAAGLGRAGRVRIQISAVAAPEHRADVARVLREAGVAEVLVSPVLSAPGPQ